MGDGERPLRGADWPADSNATQGRTYSPIMATFLHSAARLCHTSSASGVQSFSLISFN